MNDEQVIIKELNELSTAAFKQAEELCKALEAIGHIDMGTPTEEEAQKYQSLLLEIDRRRAFVLRRLLLEYGNLLFV